MNKIEIENVQIYAIETDLLEKLIMLINFYQLEEQDIKDLCHNFSVKLNNVSATADRIVMMRELKQNNARTMQKDFA